jgi:hypothetical protein
LSAFTVLVGAGVVGQTSFWIGGRTGRQVESATSAC